MKMLGRECRKGDEREGVMNEKMKKGGGRKVVSKEEIE